VETKDRILKSAELLFLRLGIKSVTMDDIANELGISKKTIYLHFTDKDQMHLATLFKFINNKGELAMISNSDPKNFNPKDNFFDDLYKEYNIIRIPARRMINADASKRGNINEIVVTNYPVSPRSK